MIVYSLLGTVLRMLCSSYNAYYNAYYLYIQLNYGISQTNEQMTIVIEILCKGVHI